MIYAIHNYNELRYDVQILLSFMYDLSLNRCGGSESVPQFHHYGDPSELWPSPPFKKKREGYIFIAAKLMIMADNQCSSGFFWS